MQLVAYSLPFRGGSSRHTQKYIYKYPHTHADCNENCKKPLQTNTIVGVFLAFLRLTTQSYMTKMKNCIAERT